MQFDPSAVLPPLPMRCAGNGAGWDIDCAEVSRCLLVVLARSELMTGGAADVQATGFQRAVRAALFVLECEPPWTDAQQRQHWAHAPDAYREEELMQWLLAAGLAAVALGRLQPAFLIYRWLRGALQDPSDLHLVWAAALLDAQHPSQARACLAHLAQPDTLAQLLQAMALLPDAPQEALQRLRQVQAQATEQPAVRELADEVLQALLHDADRADGVSGSDGTYGTDGSSGTVRADDHPMTRPTGTAVDG